LIGLEFGHGRVKRMLSPPERVETLVPVGKTYEDRLGSSCVRNPADLSRLRRGWFGWN